MHDWGVPVPNQDGRASLEGWSWRGSLLVVGLFALLLLGGCAALVNPATRNLPVKSHPAGAEVRVDGKFVGFTPVVVRLPANHTHEIVVSLRGRSKAWMLHPHWTSGSTVGVVGDLLVLVPTGTLGLTTVALGSADFGGPSVTALGVAMIGVAITPLVVDTASGRFVTIDDKPLVAEFH